MGYRLRQQKARAQELWEWQKSRVDEIADVRGILRVGTPRQLATVPGEDKDLDRIV
jgi:hypothetical protein